MLTFLQFDTPFYGKVLTIVQWSEKDPFLSVFTEEKQQKSFVFHKEQAKETPYSAFFWIGLCTPYVAY